jgi:hypothetical protein
VSVREGGLEPPRCYPLAPQSRGAEGLRDVAGQRIPRWLVLPAASRTSGGELSRGVTVASSFFPSSFLARSRHASGQVRAMRLGTPQGMQPTTRGPSGCLMSRSHPRQVAECGTQRWSQVRHHQAPCLARPSVSWEPQCGQPLPPILAMWVSSFLPVPSFAQSRDLHNTGRILRGVFTYPFGWLWAVAGETCCS